MIKKFIVVFFSFAFPLIFLISDTKNVKDMDSNKSNFSHFTRYMVTDIKANQVSVIKLIKWMRITWVPK